MHYCRRSISAHHGTATNEEWENPGISDRAPHRGAPTNMDVDAAVRTPLQSRRQAVKYA